MSMSRLSIALRADTILAAGANVVGEAPNITPNQDFDMGALTQAGNGWFIPENTGGAVTNWTISTDDPDNAGHLQIDATTGKVTPTAAGDTADLPGNAQDKYVLGITATNAADPVGTEVFIDVFTQGNNADGVDRGQAYSVSESQDYTDINTLGVAPVEGKTILARDTGASNYATRPFMNAAYTVETVFTSHDQSNPTTLQRMLLDQAEKHTWRKLKFEVTDETDTNENLFIADDTTIDLHLDECELHGNPLDINTDWTGIYPGNISGFKGGTGAPQNLKITGCLFKNVHKGISVTQLTSALTIQGNRIENIYEDGIVMSHNNATGIRLITDNFIWNHFNRDTLGGHGDSIQSFFPATFSENMENLIIERNIVGTSLEDAICQGIYCQGPPRPYYHRNCKVNFNTVMASTAHGVLLDLAGEGCEVGNNTLIRPNPVWTQDITQVRASLNAGADGTVKLWNNIGELVSDTQANATGFVKFTAGTTGQISGITVNGVQIMSGAEAFDTDLDTTLGNVVSNINLNTSTPNYTAALSASEDLIIITAATSGSGPQGFAVVTTVTGDFAKTDHNMVYNTIDRQRNVELGGGGATIAYNVALVGTTWPATTLAEIKSKLAINFSGSAPADQDSSGAASRYDSGSLGSGAVTYAAASPSNTLGTDDDTYLTSGVSTDPNVNSVDADGWQINYTSPPAGDFDPVGDPKYVVVTRSGFDASANAISVVDNLLIMKRVRQAYPNQASLTANNCAIQNFVFSGETITGVTNNSTRAYSKHDPKAMWLNDPREIERTGTHTVRLAVAHDFARSGRPVACVKFVAEDESTNTVEVIVSTMDTISYTASGLSVSHFKADLNLSTLDAEEEITVNAIIYPWVGDSFDISTDASSNPNPNLCELKFLNDKSDTFGTAYAYVSTTGNDGTGVVSTTPATAQASPYLTVAAAAAGIKTYNNTNFSRNFTDGGIIRLENGTYTHATFQASNTQNWPIQIEGVSTGAVYQDSGASVFNGLPYHTKWVNVTLKQTGSFIFMDNGATDLNRWLTFENCTWDINGQSKYDAWIYRTGLITYINCGGDNVGQTANFSTIIKQCNSIGCGGTGHMGKWCYNAAGTKDLKTIIEAISANGNRPEGVGRFFGFDFMGQDVNSTKNFGLSAAIGARGLAVIGCVVEQSGGTGNTCIDILTNIVTNGGENITVMCNTIVGSRDNILYEDSGTVETIKHACLRFNVHREINMKGDVFGTNGNLTGNWAALYKVGWHSNTYREGSSNQDTFGVGSQAGEIAAIGELIGTNASPIDGDWADDQSFEAAGSGDGDYTPGASNGLSTIPSGLAPHSHDMSGAAIPDNGTGLAGALQ